MLLLFFDNLLTEVPTAAINILITAAIEYALAALGLDFLFTIARIMPTNGNIKETITKPILTLPALVIGSVAA